MTNKEAADVLTRYNVWRRDNKTEFPIPYPDSSVLIGEAIDVGIRALRGLEEAKDLLCRYAVFGLGAVERQPVRWGNCAKPVLVAGGIFSTKLQSKN